MAGSAGRRSGVPRNWTGWGCDDEAADGIDEKCYGRVPEKVGPPCCKIGSEILTLFHLPASADPAASDLQKFGIETLQNNPVEA